LGVGDFEVSSVAFGGYRWYYRLVWRLDWDLS
jgi:hypothetical protein